jgi:membrane protease YdiL (CAAX protease family)
MFRSALPEEAMMSMAEPGPADPSDAPPPELIPVGPARRSFPWQTAAWLLAASVVGSVLVVPFSMALLKQTKETRALPEVVYPLIMASEVAFETLIAAAAIAAGLGLGPRAGLGRPLLDGLGPDESVRDRRRAGRALALGAALGVGLGALLSAAGVVFEPYLHAKQDIKLPSALACLIASVGAGIREEVWLRLGFMTFLAWLGALVARRSPAGPGTVWAANVLAALLFGAIHLPQAAGLLGLTGPVVAFVLLGNAIPGVVWGWLYWRKGLIAAMASHAAADIVMKVIFPAIGWE